MFLEYIFKLINTFETKYSEEKSEVIKRTN